MFRRYRGLSAVGVVIAIALLSLGVVPGSGLVQAEPGKAEEFQLEVVGVGKATADPDYAIVQSAVEGAGATPEEARSAGEQLYEAVRQAVADIDVALIPGHYGIHPRHEYSEERREPQVVGYTASRSIEVRVSDITLVGDVLARLLDAGVASIHGVRFGALDSDAVRTQAIEAAIDDAAQQADAVASAMSARVARVAKISVAGQAPGPIVYAMREERSNSFDPSPVEVESNVTVRYILQH